MRSNRIPCVLVVEADNNVREMILELLDAEGFHCTEAANPDAAILAIRSHAFDGVVAERSLFEARRQPLVDALAAHAPDAGILLTDAGANGATRDSEYGFRVIQKPFQTATFLRALRRALLSSSGDD